MINSQQLSRRKVNYSQVFLTLNLIPFSVFQDWLKNILKSRILGTYIHVNNYRQLDDCYNENIARIFYRAIKK